MFDKAKSEAIRRGLNMMLNGKYGSIETLNLETKTKKLSLTLLLNGETETVVVNGRYLIDDANPDKMKVSLHDLKVSRQWMQELASDQVEGKSVEVPQKLSSVVKMIL